MNLYTSQGWLDAPAIRRGALPFTAIWGGRGIGKTYGFLRSVRYDDPAPFILLRRTQTMIDILSNPAYSPFRVIDRDCNAVTAVTKMTKYVTAFYGSDEDGKPAGSPVGYAMALSTIHNIRGFSADDIEYIIYDEFIPEPHERPIKNEYEALLNAYETINRNRELQGREPVKLIMLTNSNTLANPYFLGMGVLRQVDRMLTKQQTIWTDRQRGIMLINILGSPISEAKADTALYRMTGSKSAFGRMSLGNEFVSDHRSECRKIPLPECIPLVAIGEICVYRHKTRREFYVTDIVAGSPPVYAADNTDLQRCVHSFAYLITAYLDDRVVFGDYLSEVLFRKYLLT